MWLLVLYDLPTETKKQKKRASLFRKRLLKDGFKMFQYSVYLRYADSIENANTHKTRVKNVLPNEGAVLILQLTDKQFNHAENYYSKTRIDSGEMPDQLLIF